MSSQTAAVKRRVEEKKSLRTQLMQSNALPHSQIEILCSLDSELDLLAHIKKQLSSSIVQLETLNRPTFVNPRLPTVPPTNFWGPDPDHLRPPGWEDFERDRNPPLPQFPGLPRFPFR